MNKKLTYIDDYKVKKVTPVDFDMNNDTMEVIKRTEAWYMDKETYSKSEIDLKLQNLETKVDSQFALLNERLESSTEHILSETKSMLKDLQLSQYKEREAERRVANRWFIGLLVTIGIALLKLFWPFILKLFSS